MSLFGTFADVSMPDVISLIGSGSGTFIIRLQQSEYVEEYELGMLSGHISRMSFNGQEILSPEQAQSFITELMRDNRGDFEFHRGPIVKGSLWIHTTEALLSSVSILDEMAGLKANFPDPHTVFLANGIDPGALNPESRAFWRDVESHFQQGICAIDLSEELGLFLDQIQLKLYKLQLAKAIVPKRAFYKTEPLPFPKREILLEQNLDPELKTLLQKLEPIWSEPANPSLPETGKKTAPLREMKKEGALSADSSSKEKRLNFDTVKIYKPDRQAMGHFMTSIKKLMRVG